MTIRGVDKRGSVFRCDQTCHVGTLQVFVKVRELTEEVEASTREAAELPSELRLEF